jgi:hypothetical protein
LREATPTEVTGLGCADHKIITLNTSSEEYMIWAVVLGLSLSWAQNDKEISFKDKARVSVDSVKIDNQSNEISLNCKGYSNPTSQGIKARLKSAAGISYALDCKGLETGDGIDLLVFKSGKQVSRFVSVAQRGGDCGYRSESQSWLVDMNGDKMMDVVTRFKSKNVEADCGEGHKKAESQDSMTVYFWNGDKLQHEKANLDAKDIKKLEKKYDFNI